MLIFILLSIFSLDEALLNLQKVRGERPLKPIQVEIIDKNKLEKYVLEALDDTYGSDLKNFEEVLNFFNLLKNNKSYKESAVSLYKEQAAAFYNPKDHSLKVMEGISEENIFLQSALVHELMHALQDEKIGIYEEMEKRKNNYDSMMALQSFLEGEALIVTFISMGDVNIDQEEEFLILKNSSIELIENLEEFIPDEDDFVVYEVFLPYKTGSTFVLHHFEDGRWAGIDKIYASLPCSMEEIIHFEKMPDFPKDFLKLSKKIKIKDSKKIYSNTFGESFIYLIFSKYLSNEDALKKAEGWGGDKLNLFKRNNEYFIVWLLEWDTPDDLKEALDGFQTFAKNEGIKLVPFIYNKSMILVFYKNQKLDLSPDIFNILRKMEEQNVYECKSK